MSKLIKSTGDIAIGTLLTIGFFVIGAIGGSYGFTEAKTNQLERAVNETAVKVSSLEADRKNMQADIVEIKADLKELLRRTK